MRIGICGELTLEDGGTIVRETALPGRLGRRLWAYLVLNRRRPVGREELYTALWTDDAPEAADASLNALVSRARAAVSAVGDGIEIRASAGHYTLALPADVLVDRERAWAAVNHVRAIRRTGAVRDAWSEAVIANEISARGFLPGEAGTWIESERRVLRDIEMQALEAICEAELAQQRPEEAERVARRLIAADPLRESGYRGLMRAHAAGGNPAQATRVMEECRAALAAVGMQPSPDTERALRDALRH